MHVTAIGESSSDLPIPLHEFKNSFNLLVERYPPNRVDRVDGGIYHGVAGVALLCWKLDKWAPIVLKNQVSDCKFRLMFDAYWLSIKDKRFIDPRGSSCGAACDYLAQLTLRILRDEKIDQSIDEICKWATELGQDLRASNEWLYGRAGFLYYIRLCMAHAPNDAKLACAADALISGILQAPRPWLWHDTEYIGAAHGAVGIITQVLLTDPSKSEVLKKDLRYVLNVQQEEGNWPASKHSTHDRLMQFCHGAPGVVSSLKCIRHLYERDFQFLSEIDEAIDSGTLAIASRTRYMKKEACLCHGAAGNAISISNQETRLEIMKQSTEDFIHSHSADLDLSSARASLYSGLAGRVWAWFVASCSEVRGYLGYNELMAQVISSRML